jgi:hypothetical protein
LSRRRRSRKAQAAILTARVTELIKEQTMRIKTTTIESTCGIYDTEYTLRDYGTKLIVTEPYIKWEQNTGCLAFEKTRVTNAKTMAVIRNMFADDELINDDQICLSDVLAGNYGFLPRA